MRYKAQLLQVRLQPRLWFPALVEVLRSVSKNSLNFLDTVKTIGVTPGMSVVERSKLGIFNHLNFFQFITGMLVPGIAMFRNGSFPGNGWAIACLPSMVSILVLFLNSSFRHREALLSYFIFYPLFICFGYINGINLGIELSFILYGVLAVFFIQDIGAMLFSIGFSMISYFILIVVLKSYPYRLEHINYIAYLFNQALAIVYIFYGLYLVKTENTNYNSALQQTNEEIQKQAEILQVQAEELEKLNALKNRMFSIISHDLKAPMYALRNLFENMHQQNIPGRDIKAMIPDIKNDLNYTVALMENLLHWSKAQMQSHTVKAEVLHISGIVDELIQLLHLQSDAKGIKVENTSDEQDYAWGDFNMISLVLRNLITNAIKFTPPGGHISIGTHHQGTFIEIYVQDNGKGISAEEMDKINAHEFYTTNGTAQEQGTGLGLLLCKEFVTRNGGQLRIESRTGEGSTFSFTLHAPQHP